MKSVREAVHNIIAERILPRLERDGISKLLLPEQIESTDYPGARVPKESGYSHREPEFGIGLTGKSPYSITRKIFVFTPGAMVLLPPGTLHSSIEVKTEFRQIKDLDIDKPSSVLWFGIYPFGVRVQVIRLIGKLEREELTYPYMLLGWRFSRLMADLLEEVRDRPIGYARIGRLILMEFMERCLRAKAVTAAVDMLEIPYRHQPSPRQRRAGKQSRQGRTPRGRRTASSAAKNRPKKGRHAAQDHRTASEQLPRRVQAAREFIHSNYYTLINLDDIADAAETNPDYLSRIFKAATGVTPIRYLLNFRIEAAKELILTDLNVIAVASMVGIEDPYYFSRVFRQIVGVSPTKYRRKMAKIASPHPPM